MNHHNYKTYIGECLGTAFLIFVILSSHGNMYAISAAFFTVMFTISKISGAHVNPVVTIITIMNKKLPKSEFVPFVISQLSGGLLGFELYKFIQ